MTSVQDHASVITDGRQHDPQVTHQAPPIIRDIPDPARALNSEVQRESPPPRFSQLPDSRPEATGSNSAGSDPLTATNSATLANHLGTDPAPNLTVSVGDPQSVPVIQDRTRNQSAFLTPGRRRPALSDDPRGDSVLRVYLPDDGEPDHKDQTPWLTVPRPIFNPAQDGYGVGDGSGTRGAPKGISDINWFSDPLKLKLPVRLALVGAVIAPKTLMLVL
jgi:hypothetical protein